MVLEIGGGLFGQQDVRETESTTNLPSGIGYASTMAVAFSSLNPATDVMIINSGGAQVSTGSTNMYGAIQLPDGAVITGAIMYGNATMAGARTWTMYRKTLSGGSSSAIGTAAVNTEDTTLSNTGVDNSTYTYLFHSALGAGDVLYGVRVTYTI